MSLTINPDIVVQQELQSRGVDSSVGVFGSHHVQIRKGSPIRLDVIKSAKVPFAGFRTVTQIKRGKAGIEQTASDALKTLASPGSLNAGKLLGLLKAQQTHLDRLTALNQLDPAQKQDADGLWMFTKAVENLSNEDLASIFQKFTSSEMDLLQTALMREGQINPAARDARIAASRLFNLQALVLKEIGNRAALSNLSDLRGADPADETLKDENLRLPQKLSDEYGSSGVNDVVAEPVHEKDITATNMAVLTEVSAQSATKRENIATTERAKLDARGLGDVQLKEMGDVLRSAELTINIPLDILAGKTSVFADPTKPLANIWHLHDQHIDCTTSTSTPRARATSTSATASRRSSSPSSPSTTSTPTSVPSMAPSTSSTSTTAAPPFTATPSSSSSRKSLGAPPTPSSTPSFRRH